MQENPLVSVGMPTYNRPDELRTALSCITTQTYRNIEIIISDNGSNNALVSEVINNFRANDSRIRFFEQEKNIGMAENFQFVLQKATGDYFMWAADDDQFSLNYIEENLKKIVEDPSVIGSYGCIKAESSAENAITIQEYAHKNKYSRIRTYLRNPSYNMCFFALFRTRVIKRINIKLFGYYAGDWLFVASLLKKGKLVNSDNTYAIRGPGGLSSDPFQLLQYFYKDSKFRFVPFLKPMLRYFKLDFISAFLNTDVLLYYNFYYAGIAWDNYLPGKHFFIKKISARIRVLMERCMFLNDKYLYKIKPS